MYIPRNKEENIGGLKLRKIFLSLTSDEGVSCNSGTRFDRKAPRTKMYCFGEIMATNTTPPVVTHQQTKERCLSRRSALNFHRRKAACG
jgi:hypothetical protein